MCNLGYVDAAWYIVFEITISAEVKIMTTSV
jgi:hypothetical protein